MASTAALAAVLRNINAGYYTPKVLNGMSSNDMMYAIRQAGAEDSIALIGLGVGTPVMVRRVSGEVGDREVVLAGDPLLGGGGAGQLLAANNLSDLLSVITARTNLGLGSAALSPVGAFDPAGTGAAAQAAAVQRVNHTGTQVAATISDLVEVVQDIAGALLIDSATLDMVYNDAANTLSAAVLDSPKVGGVAITGVPTAGQVPIASAAAAAAWGAVPATGPTLVRKTADETVTNSGVLQNDDHLFFVSEANATYRVDIQVLYISTIQNVKFGFTGPAGFTYNGLMLYSNTGNIANGNVSAYSESTFNEATLLPVGPISAADPDFKWIRFSLLVTVGATAGTFRFQWAQNAANATGSTLKINSTLTYQKIS